MIVHTINKCSYDLYYIMDIESVRQRVKLFKQSYLIFNKIYSSFNPAVNGTKYAHELTNYFNVSADEYGCKQITTILQQTNSVLKTYMALPKSHKLSNIKKYKTFSKKFNKTIEEFKSYLKDNTEMYAFTTVNKYCVLHDNVCAFLIDILTLEKFKPNEKHLKLNGGHVIQFVDPAYFLNCLKAHVDKCTIDNVDFGRNFLKNIQFIHSSSDENRNTNIVSYIDSHDSRIRKLFEPDNMTTYNLFCDYALAKQAQLIKSQWNNPNYPYRYITCMKCNKSVVKLLNPQNKLYTCLCGFNMCRNGCGMFYHGNSICGEDNKISTAEIIKLFVNSQCPGCKQYLEKISGCNHMTCKCGIQYCHKCGTEFQKDEYNQYMITEHFRYLCSQNSRTSNIAMPDIDTLQKIVDIQTNNVHDNTITIEFADNIKQTNYELFESDLCWCFKICILIFMLSLCIKFFI